MSSFIEAVGLAGFYIIMAGQPFGDACRAGMDHTLVNVELIQNITQFPAKLFVDHILNRVFCVAIQKRFQICNAAGDSGEEGLLVHDPLIHRGRLKADHGLIAHILIVLLDILCQFCQTVQGEYEGIFAVQIILIFGRQITV